MNTDKNELFQSFVELVELGKVNLFMNEEGKMFAKRDDEWYLVTEDLQRYVEVNYTVSQIN